MKLRLKCKKLKQENERLKNWLPTTPNDWSRFRKERYKHQKLTARKMIPEYEETIPLDDVKRNMVLELADSLYPYINFEDYIDVSTGCRVVMASLNIIVPDEREV